MPKNNKNDVEPGILLLAKKSGKTSFASLGAVKHALGTSKVGHTGTLDSFADGLLVVLTGRLTHLVPHITDFDKRYLALIHFGSETDTLDPTGVVVKTSPVPTEKAVSDVLSQFRGEIDQVPPLYSALHINGKRASDLARSGKTAKIPSRKIKIYSLELKEFSGEYALVEVCCSKGTYIRALARDIAYACGSCAYLKALRRVSVGPFLLEEAAGSDKLGEFTISSLLKKTADVVTVESNEKTSDSEKLEIKRKFLPMSAELACRCGLVKAFLDESFVKSYNNGRPLSFSVLESKEPFPDDCDIAVFYQDGSFAGIIKKNGKKLSYGFMVPKKKRFRVYTWKQLLNGDFDASFKQAGTALTIGSFDGPHKGHEALFKAVLEQKIKNNLVPGIVTFTRSLRGLKDPAHKGDVATLAQRLEIFDSMGFSFAIVIDFSDDFGRIEGTEFLKVLIDSCRMKFLAEGRDFHCGYKGAADMDFIRRFGENNGFELKTIEPVFYNEEKISSSRIRDSILSKDFYSAEYMLSRPFSLDCSGFDWSFSDENGFRVLSAKKSGIQVFPPDGTYAVLVNIDFRQQSGEAQSSVSVLAYRSDCTLENGSLRLSFPGKLIGGFVRTIQFGYPDENNFIKE